MKGLVRTQESENTKPRELASHIGDEGQLGEQPLSAQDAEEGATQPLSKWKQQWVLKG